MSPPKREDAIVTRTRPAPSVAARNRDASAIPKSKRRQGRTFKHPIRGSSARSSRSRSGPYDRPSNSPRHIISRPHTPRRMMSLIEALPVEIIEQIFLHSLNLSFPRASPFLSRALSREHIYRALILLAFWDDPTSHPGSKAIDRMMAPLQYVPLPLEEQIKLQESIFKCRWCTVDRVREQVPTIQILTVHRHWINAGIVTNEEEQAQFGKFLTRQDDSVCIFHGKGPAMEGIARMLEARDGPSFSEVAPDAKRPGLHEYELRVYPMFKTEIRCRSLKTTIISPALNLCRFPSHLLRGPSNGFLPDDLAFLEMLRITSANWDPGMSPSVPSTITKVDRKALNEGIQNAIRHKNLGAMVSLLKIDEFIFRFKEENRHREMFYTIPPDHFIAVTRLYHDDPELSMGFFESLVRASAESVPSYSPEITQWTVDNMELARKNPEAYNESNGKFARWLANFLLRLPQQIDYAHRSGQLFYCGQLHVSCTERYNFIEQVLEPYRKPLGNWLKESVFRSEDYWLKKSGPPLPPTT